MESTAAEYFRRMYGAHDTIADIREKIDKLERSAEYISPSFGSSSPRSAPDPKRFESTMTEIADLWTMGENLLRERARFDLFVCTLTRAEAELLSMRYERNMSWKEISFEMNISDNTARLRLEKIEEKAENFGCFSTI